MNPRRFTLLLAACGLLALALGFLRAPRPAPAAERVAPATEAWRAALPADPEAATRAYLARIPPAARVRSDAYTLGGYWLQLWTTLASLGVLALMVGSGASAAWRDWAERKARRPWLRTLLYAGPFALSLWVAGLPLAVAGGFLRDHRYGLATQAFLPWMVDQVVSFLVVGLLGALAAVPLMAALRRFPRAGWVWATGIASAALAFFLVIGPVFVDPLFNTYKPLPPGPARSALQAMAQAHGVPSAGIYVFDASRQTSQIGGMVSGLGGTTAIRLYDNLLDQCSLAEVKAVMAHELGHYVEHHPLKLLLLSTLVLAACFAFAQEACRRLVPRRLGRFGLRDGADLAALPVLAGLFLAAMAAATPVWNTLVRAQETRADAFGLEAAREPDGFAEAELKLVQHTRVDPGPLETWVFYDHPSPRQRIQAAMEWKAKHGQGLTD